MPKQKTYFSSDFKLGILGGGQLGKMLLSVTRQYDIATKVLDPSETAPGRIASNTFVQGDLMDEETVYKFGQDCDVVTIEIEGVNIEALKRLEREGKKVFPRPAALEVIKNKCVQKEFYRANKIPTAPFHTVKSRKELLNLLEHDEISYPFVWKAASGGYDGRGVEIIKGPERLEEIPDVEGLCEDLIPFEKELAVIVARSEDGSTKCFPLVEMDFHPTANLVEYVFSPSTLEQRLQNKAATLATQIAEKLDHVGLLAVEMFLSENENILVNEVAPRVHNSGHLTIEGNITSQFEQHIRSILNLPLGDTSVLRPAVMINLTGEEGHTGPVLYKGIKKILGMPGTYLHLYGKAETRPFRKMGHITITADSLNEARAQAREVKNRIKVISKS
ncbi:MAG: 5-(carboxyamino)imidazole ribonucleotide synthase [Owenweeksia sp.]